MSSKIATAAAIAVAALGLSISQTASAVTTVAVSNLSEVNNVTTALFSAVGRAQSFTVASDQDYLLASVTVPLNVLPSGLTLAIHADNQSNPGALLEQLTFGSTAAGQLTTTATPRAVTMVTYASTGLTLTAGSTYWIRSTITGSAAASWYATASGNETGLPGWSLANTSRTTPNAGAAWNSSNLVLMTSVDVTPAAAVPESSTMAMMGAGLALLLLRRRASAQGPAAR